MVLYIPYVTDDDDYTPSWTGNVSYPTITIRGIFTTEEKAKASISGWRYENDNYNIMSYYIDDEYIEEYFSDREDDEIKEIKSLDIDYEGKNLTVFIDNHYGNYDIDKAYDEDYSAVYDEHGYLGVTDY